MLLTLSTTMPSATDLGYLLHKHPDRAQSFDVASGVVHVLWPQASAERSTCAVLLEVDPIALVRGRGKGPESFALAQYVNDRPYAASSMLSVALGRVFRTAMGGRCDARPELAAQPIPLEVHIPALPSRGGPELVQRLFAPLGWSVEASALPLDPQIPAWGDSPYLDVRLTGTVRLADALTQLYVLMPVLDDSKHYWVSEDEVDKLLRAGGSWLAEHPERELITRRYLGHHRDLVRGAIGRLAEIDEVDAAVFDDAVLENAVPGSTEDANDAPATRPLVQLRKAAVLDALRRAGASSVVDLGCGEGALLRELLADPSFGHVIGVDVSARALQLAAKRLRVERLPDRVRERLELFQSSLTYRDDRLAGQDAIVLMEVIEHVDPPRLPALERSVFGYARPATVVVTTPNSEHNVRYESLAAGALRHRDHRFEWTRAQFAAWAERTAAAYGYTVQYEPVGPDDPEVGPPTQLAVFGRAA